jgi:hypothetical protein
MKTTESRILLRRRLPRLVVTLLCLFLEVGNVQPSRGKDSPSEPPSMDSAAATVDLGTLPAGWAKQRQVMDEMWQSLKLKGVNYYAFGAAQPPHPFAARSDPASPLYQAWFGAYAVQGGRNFVSNSDKDFDWVAKLAEFDQVSWLAAMGDPRPEAKWIKHSAPEQESIDGAQRVLYRATMISHSDLSSPGPNSTALSQKLGMPEAHALRIDVKPFHPITLTGYYAFWYDDKRDMTFVVYGVWSSFKSMDGSTHDNGMALQHELRRMIRGVRIVSAK